MFGKEDASIPGVVGAIAFAVVATSGHVFVPTGHEIAWLCLFGCSLATFFGSFKPTA